MRSERWTAAAALARAGVLVLALSPAIVAQDAPPGEAAPPNPSGLSAEERQRMSAFAAAIADFRARRWDAAEAALQNLKERTEELLYNVYLDRIEQFRRVPPPADWDGVFEHLTK